MSGRTQKLRFPLWVSAAIALSALSSSGSPNCEPNIRRYSEIFLIENSMLFRSRMIVPPCASSLGRRRSVLRAARIHSVQSVRESRLLFCGPVRNPSRLANSSICARPTIPDSRAAATNSSTVAVDFMTFAGSKLFTRKPPVASTCPRQPTLFACVTRFKSTRCSVVKAAGINAGFRGCDLGHEITFFCNAGASKSLILRRPAPVTRWSCSAAW